MIYIQAAYLAFLALIFQRTYREIVRFNNFFQLQL